MIESKMTSEQRLADTLQKMVELQNMMIDVAYRMDALNIDALDAHVGELAGAAEVLGTWIEGVKNKGAV